MSYTDLIPLPLVSLVGSDNSSATVTDGTGTYPDSAGGYAPTGESTDTRPTFAQTQRWVFYRKRNSDGTWLPYIPLTQGDSSSDPFSTEITLLEYLTSNPFPDAAWQIFLLVVPLALDYATYIEEAYDFDAFLQLGYELGAVGQVALFANGDTTPCVNYALQDFNDKWTSGGCQCGAYARKKALQQGVVSALAIGESFTTTEIPSPTTTSWYQKAAVMITALLNQCSTNSCSC
ncbi:MAG TPA: hypothetical protein PKY12_03365 [Catalimonadaceae bacterium]|nr:hypothetical protein [Catalimonadaceae bacterium]